jgi:transposase
MVTLGIDAHKRTHTVVAIDEVGRQLGSKTTTGTTSDDHLALVRWAERFDGDDGGRLRTVGICRADSKPICCGPVR